MELQDFPKVMSLEKVEVNKKYCSLCRRTSFHISPTTKTTVGGEITFALLGLGHSHELLCKPR